MAAKKAGSKKKRAPRKRKPKTVVLRGVTAETLERFTQAGIGIPKYIRQLARDAAETAARAILSALKESVCEAGTDGAKEDGS